MSLKVGFKGPGFGSGWWDSGLSSGFSCTRSSRVVSDGEGTRKCGERRSRDYEEGITRKVEHRTRVGLGMYNNVADAPRKSRKHNSIHATTCQGLYKVRTLGGRGREGEGGKAMQRGRNSGVGVIRTRKAVLVDVGAMSTGSEREGRDEWTNDKTMRTKEG